MSEQREALARDMCNASLDHGAGRGRHNADKYGPCGLHEQAAREALDSPTLARLLADAEQRGADRVAAAVEVTVTEAADPVHAGGCYYRHQQGETDECNSCAVFQIETAIRAALTTGAADRVRAEALREVRASLLALSDQWYPGEPGPRRMSSWGQLAKERCARELRAALAEEGGDRG